MNNNKFINALPLIAIAILGYLSLTKAQPSSFLSENNSSADLANNPDMPNNLIEYEVVPNSIHDGDTLRVRSPKGEILKIRFACIDAPELKQPLGEESRNYLRSLVNRGGNKVKVQPVATDRYGRTVAQLWNSNGLIQSQMVSAGMAYKYDRYKADCLNWPAIESTEKYAKEMKLGVWRSPEGGERPWDYRKSKRD